MSVWSEPIAAPASLIGREGSLVLVRIRVEPRFLEELLEALAEVPFPVNPELVHGSPWTLVEFPAYEHRLDEVRDVLQQHGFPASSVTTANMLDVIRG